jgi:hypothetical protein
LIVLLPVLRDLVRHGRGEQDRLSAELASLEDLGEKPGDVTVVNLLPVFLAGNRDWRTYYFPCDYHWNAAANYVAASYLRRFYQPPEQPESPTAATR